MVKSLLAMLLIILFAGCNKEKSPQSSETIRILSDKKSDLIYVDFFKEEAFTVASKIPNESGNRELRLYIIKEGVEYPLYSISCDFWNNYCRAAEEIICTQGYSDVSGRRVLACRDNQLDGHDDGTTTPYYLDAGTIHIYSELRYIGTNSGLEESLAYEMIRWEMSGGA